MNIISSNQECDFYQAKIIDFGAQWRTRIPDFFTYLPPNTDGKKRSEISISAKSDCKVIARIIFAIFEELVRLSSGVLKSISSGVGFRAQKSPCKSAKLPYFTGVFSIDHMLNCRHKKIASNLFWY